VRFSLALKIATFLLAAVSALPTAVSGEVGWWAVAVLVVLGAIGPWLEPPLTESRRFRRAILAIAACLLAAQLARAFTGTPAARVALEFSIVLLGLKLCSRGRFSDYQQIAALGFLNIIGATITNFDLVYAASFLAFVLLSPVVLTLSHLRGEMEKRFHGDGSAEGKVALERLFASRRVVSLGFLFGVSALSLPVLAITAVLFLGFPRLGFGFFGRASAPPSIAGMTNEVRIGDLDRDRDEQTIVMRLEPVGAPPAGGWPAVLPMKLRGAVFDTYDGRKWTRRAADAWKPLGHEGYEYPLAPGALGRARGRAFDLLLEPLEPPYAFVPVGTARIVTEPVVRLGRFERRQLEANAAGMIRYRDDARVGVRYRVFAAEAPVFGREADDAAYLSLPPQSARLAAAARGLAEDGEDGQKAARIVSWLQREHAYGVPAPAAAGVDPVARFLFDERRGTCEHFATSATLMLRAVGVRARLVTGFGSAEYNSIGGYYAVRTRAAHAWVEAFVGGAWRTIEATPPANEGARIEEPSALLLAIDALRMRWHKYVIGFDINTQMELGSWLMDQRRSGALSHVEVPWRIVGAVFAAAIGVALAILIARARLKRLRRARPRGGPKRRDVAGAVSLYLALEKRLAALGYARSPHVTPLEHLAALPGAGALAKCASRVTARYNEVRFGGGAFAPGERERLGAEIRALDAR
jgi:protein-glutamine gamma-glutamyltransferase